MRMVCVDAWKCKEDCMFRNAWVVDEFEDLECIIEIKQKEQEEQNGTRN